MSAPTPSVETPRSNAHRDVAVRVRGRQARAIFWLVVLAFAVRIGFMLAAHTYLFASYRVDDYSYLNETTSIARSIAEGRGFSSPFSPAYTGPTSWVAPVYPYLCAIFFAGFGVLSTKAAAALLTLQSLFSALTCIPILGIGERTLYRKLKEYALV